LQDVHYMLINVLRSGDETDPDYHSICKVRPEVCALFVTRKQVGLI
jgi:hypothetical protein